VNDSLRSNADAARGASMENGNFTEKFRRFGV
jgi:hypothetical protein